MPQTTGVPSQAIHPFNTRLYYAPWNTSDDTGVLDGQLVPGSLTALLAEVTELAFCTAINGLELKPGTTDITWLGSPGKAKEKIAGWLDAGQVTFTLQYSKATQQTLISLMPTNGVLVPPAMGRFCWALVLPDEGVWIFTGFVAGQPKKSEGAKSDSEITLDVTIEINGLPNFYSFSD